MSEPSFSSVIEIELQKSVELFSSQRFEQAADSFDAILRLNSQHPAAMHFLGLCRFRLGETELGLRLLQESVKLAPGCAAFHNNVGLVYSELRQWNNAARFLKNACDLDPSSSSYFNNFGTVLQKLGFTTEAIICYRKAVAIEPTFAPAVTNLATVLGSRGEIGEALGLMESVAGGLKNVPEFHFNVGQLHALNEDFAQASASFSRAVSLKPDYAEALAGWARALKTQGDLTGALQQLERCATLQPSSAAAYLEFGHLLREQGQASAAYEQYRRSAELDPMNWYAQWNACLTLPVLYREESELTIWRERWRMGIRQLDSWMKAQKGHLLPPIAPHTNFYLHYQGQNDLEEQREFARVITRLASGAAQSGANHLQPKRSVGRSKVRVGFASAFFNLHTVFKLFHGWIRHLDRKRFEVFSFHLGNKNDKATEYTRNISDHFSACHADRETAIQAILENELDLLIYPELGMDPLTLSLAALRLAPVQCMSWGHPVTSGLGTIDYFLSSELMEIPSADTHYSEKLIRLPNLSVSFVEPDPATARVPESLLREEPDKVRYGCLQSLFKLLPQYDEIYPRIALRVPEARFAFISAESEGITRLFVERLAVSFRKHGLEAERFVRILPRMTYGNFLGFIDACDVILDSVGWSGGTTTLEAIAFDKPTVTLPGEMMRSRHTAAILKRAGCSELIASSLEDYIRIAGDLGCYLSGRARMVTAIRSGKGALYRDLEPVQAMEEILLAIHRSS